MLVFISLLRSFTFSSIYSFLSSQEMTQLISLASEFDKKFRILEDYFNTLTTAQKSYLCKGSDAALPPPPPVPESSADCSLPSVPTEETLNDPMVVLFHSLADNVIEILCQLQPLIKFKQTHVPSIGLPARVDLSF
jgi:hypothetical protein